MAGLFGSLFGISSDEDVAKVTTTIVSDDNANGLTGVAQYLSNQKPIASATGVAKYLSIKEQNLPSGVARYLARQSIATKQKIKENLLEVVNATGVEKYLQTQDVKPKVNVSGVEKYLASHDRTTSGVAKYVARKIIAIKNAPPVLKTTGVANYLDNRKEVLVTGVSKYVAKQVLATRKLVEETVAAVESATIVEPVATSGVERYLQART
ncbi:MAG: hypothetical protein KAH08_02165 [Methylococcales bacterium]|nr:hypothetical protein [Methylococcales bacterium]